MKEELERIPCRDEACEQVLVIHYQHVTAVKAAAGIRHRKGAQGWELSTGEPVRIVDANLYEVESTGELLSRLS